MAARPSPPPDAASLCQRLQDVHHGMTFDDVLRYLGVAIESNNRCAAKHKALSDWARK